MSLQPFLPLVVAVLVALPCFLTAVSARVDRVFTRIALAVFGAYVDEVARKRSQRRRTLRAAHLPATYRAYASKTLLYAAAAGLIGGLVGLYVIWGMLLVLAVDPETLREILPVAVEFLANFAGVDALEPHELAPLLAASSLTIGAVCGLGVYWLRWWYPTNLASVRARQIDASLPQTVAFVYALSRSGMAFPQVMRILADHRRIYGSAAEEVGVAVRHVDLFGRDVITALQAMGERTPSEQFREFTENLSSVLQSGRSLSSFLHSQYEEFQEETEAQQQQLLNLLATMAEAYVTLFVAGPLFLITILVVIGIAGEPTLTPIRLVVYLLLPLGNLAFIVYLDSITDRFDGDVRTEELPEVFGGLEDIRRASDGSTRADGGTTTLEGRQEDGFEERRADNLERLWLHSRLRWVRELLGNPLRTILDEPRTILYVTIPIAVFGTLYRITGAEELTLRAVDGLVVQALLFLIGTFAVVYELHRRRINAVEAAIPDFLDRLASVNEAGMSIVESIDSVRASDLGALDPEIERLWADVRWGSDVETALRRFERRVRTRSVSRVVALVTNAMSASGNVADVLRIAADQAKSDRRLKRQRRQEMVTYVLVVYIAFGVFLVIIAALDSVLLPNLPEAGVVPDDDEAAVPAVGGPFGGLGEIDTEAYTQVFFHTALIQAVLSGFVAGQMSTGDIRAGAKHAAILLAIAYAVFLII